MVPVVPNTCLLGLLVFEIRAKQMLMTKFLMKVSPPGVHNLILSFGPKKSLCPISTLFHYYFLRYRQNKFLIIMLNMTVVPPGGNNLTKLFLQPTETLYQISSPQLFQSLRYGQNNFLIILLDLQMAPPDVEKFNQFVSSCVYMHSCVKFYNFSTHRF